jgi:hypothetical protein
METKTPPEWFSPEYPPLSRDNVGKAAVEGQIYHYPKVVRQQRDPPIPNQTMGSLSFMLFDEPHKTKGGKPIYGFVKLRGNWGEQAQFTREASKLIREVDSRFQIRAAPVGAWVPITEDDDVVKDITDVRMTDEEIHLRDEAVKQKESERRRIQREIREREEEARNEDTYDDETSLRFYTMKRVTEMKLVENRDRIQKQLDNIDESLTDTRIILKKLEVDHSTYADEWIDVYNEERHKAGIADFIPSKDLFDEYNSLTLEDLEISENLGENDGEEGSSGH